MRREPFDGDISGALYRKGKAPVIGVNSLDAPVRQRFTIAHEIAHLHLHDAPVYIDRQYRNTLSSQAVDPEEIEANRFAAALLMPKRFLVEDLRHLEQPIRVQDIEQLASRYNVSQQAMVFRLINLGVAVEDA